MQHHIFQSTFFCTNKHNIIRQLHSKFNNNLSNTKQAKTYSYRNVTICRQYNSKLRVINTYYELNKFQNSQITFYIIYKRCKPGGFCLLFNQCFRIKVDCYYANLIWLKTNKCYLSTLLRHALKYEKCSGSQQMEKNK